MPRRNYCSGCGASVNSPNTAPVCQSCRKKARTRPCAWCGADYTNTDKTRQTCSPAHGEAYCKWSRFGWTTQAVNRMLEIEPLADYGIET